MREPTTMGGDVLIDRIALAEAQKRLLGRAAPVRIGRYLILERIGKGGMGEVCSAYDPELDRKVAIKLLRSDLGLDPGARARLLREARALARLSHPNVVAVHDAGVIGRDVFVVMELVNGQTLAAFLRTAPKDWRSIRDLLVQAGRGVVAAHEAGIVHRDFKASNVLVSRDDGQLRVRVLDFGLARTSAIDEVPSSGSAPAIEPLLTRTGIVMGTPAYMAPEQILGSDVGAAADQFAFCVTLFEALYQLRPFPEQDIVARLHAIQAGRVAPPPAAASVPAWLHRTILRGLAADPSQRFASMRALLDELQLDRRKRRRGLVVTLVAVVVAVIVALALAWTLRPRPGPRELELVERIATEAHAAAARAYFVYAPVDEPSAYQKVRELEAQDDASREPAMLQAAALREEFAATLVRLGDEYWAREGGRPFAADYYAQALVFAPELAHARERTTLTPGELDELVDKAARGDWSAGERFAGASLAALAVEDPELRRQQIDALLDGDDAPAASTSARLLALVDRVEPTDDAEPSVVPPVEVPKRRSERVEEEVLIVPDDPPPAPEVTPSEPVARDDRTSAQLVVDGRAAAARGQLDTAQWLFRRALTHDSRSAAALAGLAEIEYDRGHYHSANRYARDAVRYAPKKADYRILLGDTFFKTHEYLAARRHYEEAERLGHAQAAARLELLREQSGG
ncbi:MAG TPA: protein kinase [Nannocystaceae bacterium]|nr:protein kinase [Nannocystaceae bacterium]